MKTGCFEFHTSDDVDVSLMLFQYKPETCMSTAKELLAIAYGQLTTTQRFNIKRILIVCEHYAVETFDTFKTWEFTEVSTTDDHCPIRYAMDLNHAVRNRSWTRRRAENYCGND